MESVKSSCIAFENCCPGPEVVDEYEIKSSYSQQEREELLDVSPYLYLNPYTLPNLAISMCYRDVGISMTILSNPVTIYLVDYLNVSATQYSAFVALQALPWSLKVFFGLLIDGVPIMKYRRKSWMLVGWILYIVMGIIIWKMGTPGFLVTTIMLFIMSNAYMLADISVDTMSVERAKFEPERMKGTFQTIAYSIRAFGNMIGAFLGTMLYNTSAWGWGLSISQLFLVSTMVPALGTLPVSYDLVEITSRNMEVPNLSSQINKLWDTLKLRAVWYPMIFVYIYYLFQVPNAAWNNFLVVGLGFTDFDLGVITIGSNALFWVGMMAFRTYFFNTSWRSIYVYTTLIGAVFSFLQILLILRINEALGIPDLFFALGDTAIGVAMVGIQTMPTRIIFVMLCPEGSEGLVFALLTTIGNLASQVASGIGSGLTYVWDVSNDALSAGDYSGLLTLSLVTSILHMLPLLIVWILPNSREEQRKLRDSNISDSYMGALFAIVIFVSLFGCIIVDFYIILT